MLKYLSLVAAIGAVAIGCGIASAANGVPGGGNGNSPTAQLCKNGGWMSLVRADQTPFADQGECVSYATQGGVPALPAFSIARNACTAIGGTFAAPGTDVTGAFPGATLIWTCNDWPRGLTPAPVPSTWLGYCQADGGDSSSITSNQPPAGQRTGISCLNQP
jgi:hypothetical protein